jgi:hypothetical protein
MDKRKKNGAKPGENRGQGRKPKADEVALIERLSPMDDEALRALQIGVKNGEFPFVKLFMEYRFGKPKETIDINADLKSNGNELRTLTVNVVPRKIID